MGKSFEVLSNLLIEIFWGIEGSSCIIKGIAYLSDRCVLSYHLAPSMIILASKKDDCDSQDARPTAEFI